MPTTYIQHSKMNKLIKNTLYETGEKNKTRIPTRKNKKNNTDKQFIVNIFH